MLAARATGWSLPLLLAIVPFGALVFLIVRHYVDVPVWDQWELVPLLEKSYAGSLSLGDLWAQHNEHRLVFPQLIMLGLARLSGWSIAWELALNVGLAAAILLVLAWQLGWTLHELRLQGYGWYLLPVIALLTFSLQQYENWLWGWQIQIFLNAFAVVLGLTLLARPTFRWQHFGLACVCGVVALYSFANGIAYWPIGGLLFLAAQPEADRQIRLARWLWIGIAGIAIGSYLVGYQAVGGAAPWLSVLQQPLVYGRYVLTYLGAPLFSFDQNWAAVSGLLSLAIYVWLAWSARERPLVQRRAVLPFIALGLYAIGSAAITGLGRATLGPEQALSSRYITFSNFLVLADILLLVLGTDWSRSPHWGGAVLRPALATGLAVLVVVGSAAARTKYADHQAYLAPARAALLSLSDDAMLARLYPDPAVARQRATFLQSHHLSVFRDAAP